jgi:hypothetical protein
MPPRRDALAALAGAALLALLLNLHTAAAVHLLARHTGQLFADHARHAAALSLLAAGAFSGRGAVKHSIAPRSSAWWLSAALLLVARPAVSAAAAAFLACNGSPPASRLVLVGRLAAASLVSTLPALCALSSLLSATLRQLAAPPTIAAAAGALVVLLPPVVRLPWHACTAPALAAVAAAAAACALAPPSRSRSKLAACGGLVMVAALAAAQVSSCARCAPGRPAAPGALGVLWSCELQHGGRLGIAEGLHRSGSEEYRYRLMRLDHSVMGGQWVAPEDVAQQSIYTAFHVQQVPRLLRPGGARSLHVGLGAGTAVAGMQRRGVVAGAPGGLGG